MDYHPNTKTENRIIAAIFLLVAAIAIFWPEAVHARDGAECAQATEMIVGIAKAREAGRLTRADAVSAWAHDMELVGQFPPEQRWFVTDRESEEILYAGIMSVFNENAVTPEGRGAAFFHGCVKGLDTAK